LRSIKKNLTVKQVIDFNRKLKNYNITLNYNFMSGFSNETKEDLKMTIKLMLKLAKENMNAIAGPINPVQLIPKTEILETAVKHGLKRPEKLEGWIKFDVSLKNKLDNLVWLDKARKKLLKKIYYQSLFLNDQSSYIDSRIIMKSLKLPKLIISYTLSKNKFYLG